jgi:hypothetical protein
MGTPQLRNISPMELSKGKERWVCACGSDTGSGQLSGRAARGSTFRKAACGSAFRCLFIPCKAADPRI